MRNSHRAGALAFIGMLGVASVGWAQDWPTPRGDTAQGAGQDTTQVGDQAQGLTDETVGTRVRFVNAVSTGGNLSLQANQQPLFTGIEFKKASEYQSIDKTQLKDLTLQGTGAETVEIDDLKENKHYTLVAVPDKDGKVKVEVLEDRAPEAQPENADKAHVRVVHAVPDADGANLVVVDNVEPVFEGLELGAQDDYKAIDPISGPITLQPEGEGAQPTQLGNVDLKAGHSYTLVLAGDQAASVELITLDETGIVGPEGEMDKEQHDNAIDRAADTSAVSRDTSVGGGGFGQDTTAGGFGRDTTAGGIGQDTTMGGGMGQDTTMGGMGQDTTQFPGGGQQPWPGRDTTAAPPQDPTGFPPPSRDTVPQSPTPSPEPSPTPSTQPY
jgi:hypothetical protein